MNHGDDEAAKVGLEQLDQPRLGVGVLDFDVVALQLAQQPLDPAHELALQLVAVNDQHDGGLAENVLPLQDQARGGDHGEGLARALGVPDQAGVLGLVGTAAHDFDGGARLVLAQDGFLQLVILDEEQDPFLDHFQHAERGEEGFDLGFVVGLVQVLPREDVFAVEIPRHAVEELDEVG